jgi:hypothetical protein
MNRTYLVMLEEQGMEPELYAMAEDDTLAETIRRAAAENKGALDTITVFKRMDIKVEIDGDPPVVIRGLPLSAKKSPA